ncbi:hypothetical protein PMAYCL1PPCAC_12492, partial [Pristionchus mayeri]
EREREREREGGNGLQKCQRANIVWFFESEVGIGKEDSEWIGLQMGEWEMSGEKSTEWMEMEEERMKMMREDEEMKVSDTASIEGCSSFQEVDGIWERKLRIDGNLGALRSKLLRYPYCPFKSTSQKGPALHLSKCPFGRSDGCTNGKMCVSLECDHCGMRSKKLDEMLKHYEEMDHLSIGWHFSCRVASSPSSVDHPGQCDDNLHSN